MTFSKKKVYTFLHDIDLKIERCTFQDVQFIFNGEATVTMVENNFRGSVLFEHHKCTKSEIQDCKFFQSTKTICHAKGKVYFDWNTCYGDVLFEGQSNACFEVMGCVVKKGNIRIPAPRNLSFEHNPNEERSYFDRFMKYLSLDEDTLLFDEIFSNNMVAVVDSNKEIDSEVDHCVIPEGNFKISGANYPDQLSVLSRFSFLSRSSFYTICYAILICLGLIIRKVVDSIQ